MIVSHFRVLKVSSANSVLDIYTDRIQIPHIYPSHTIHIIATIITTPSMVTTVRVYINILNYISTQNIPPNSTSTFQSNNFPNLGGCFFERILFERILFGNYNIISFELRTFGFYTFKQNIFLPFLSIPIIQKLSEGTVCKQPAPNAPPPSVSRLILVPIAPRCQ